MKIRTETGAAGRHCVRRGRGIALRLRALLLALLLLAVMLPVTAAADNTETKTVRVGWFISESFQEGGEGEAKSGFSYDYLRKVADYSAWEYEYVYGGWRELYEMLCNGEIDIMGAISVSEERKEYLLFPDTAMGVDRYYLFKRADNDTIDADDLSTFSGTRIGVLEGNRMTDFVKEWLENNGIDAELVYYNDFVTMDADLESGKIDLLPSTAERSMDQDWMEQVVFFGKEAYYMAVSSKRPDLLSDLNRALSLMDSVDPYVLQTLQYKHFNATLAKKSVTEDEKAWLEEHPVIRVGYTDNYLPYSDTDSEGQATGIVTDVISAAFEALELDTTPEIEYVAYSGYQAIAEALRSGEIDYGFPVDSDLWRLEEDGISASTEVISDRGALFYTTVCEKEDIKRLAVNESNVLQYDYTVRNYPNAQIVYYQSISDCLDAVLSGEVDGTIMDTLRVQYVTGKYEYERLSYVQLGEGTGKCYGVRQGNREALLLINRGLKLLGSSYGYDSTYKYVDQLSTYDAGDFLREHRIGIGIVALCIVAVIISLFIMYIIKQRKVIRLKESLKDEAERANRAKTAFLFNMSHDIRTPMNAVLGFNELMLRNIDNPDKLREYIEKTRISGEYLLGLINNVLEVARIDSGRESLNEEFADLTEASWYTVFEDETRRKRMTFTREFNIEHRYVFTDAHKLHEILLNIISNAFKYTPEGGLICVRLDELPCDREGYGSYVCAISDTGIGMTEEFQKQVFEPFAREHNSTESKVMGSGLGMSIVKKLVDLMGGTITVDSTPGVGTTFTIAMDLRIAENPGEYLEQEKKREQQENIRLDGVRILLAEDNELNAEIAVELLEGAGASVETARDGVECVKLLQSREPGYFSIVLMDIQMPNLDGYGAAKKIRALPDPVRAGIPIVAMTANAFDEDRKAAFEAGMDGHIAKPLDISSAIRAIAEQLHRN